MGAPSPTTTGRAVSVLLGATIGGYYGFKLLGKEYQIIKWEPLPPDRLNPDGTPKHKFKVSFRNAQPLELTEQAKEREQKTAKKLTSEETSKS